MRIKKLTPGSWASNCYLLISGSHAAVMDPSDSAEHILEVLQKEQAKPEFILLTHGHFDHITSLDSLRDLTGIPAYIHQDDFEMPSDAYQNVFMKVFGVDKHYRSPEKILRDGDKITLGEETIEVISTPGHTSGCVCYRVGNLLFTGDTLFVGARGRTDHYSGNDALLFESLHRLRQLPRDLIIYPGHGHEGLLGDALDLLEQEAH